MISVTLALICILVSVLLYAYTKMMKRLNYWAEKGVPHKKPIPFLGNASWKLFMSFDMFKNQQILYKHFANEKYFGMYTFSRPVLVIRDPELLERILVKDFQHFEDHDTPIEDKDSIMDLGLFNIKGNEWRAMRYKVSPTFSSGKLKNMLEQMMPNANKLISSLNEGDQTCRLIKTDMGTFFMDVMANVVFGIEIKNEELRKEYVKNSEAVFAMSKVKLVGLMLAFLYPKLAISLGFKMMDQDSERYFTSLIKDAFTQRLETGYERNDYVQLLLKLKQQKYLELQVNDLEDNEQRTDSKNVESFEITEKMLIAQAFQFLSAGFEPSHNTVMMLLFEIASNEEIQNKTRDEILKSLKKNGEYNYQALKDMPYLEQCFHETLRKYPVIGFLPRKCTKEYKIDDNYTVEKGTSVMVSIKAIHDDPLHYPDPSKFDPDRFQTDAHIRNYTYLSFGAGPRFCIGRRFAILEVKLAVAKILENFKLKINPKTRIPLQKTKFTFFDTPTDDIYFDLIKING